jgi:hypothetical protein
MIFLVSKNGSRTVGFMPQEGMEAPPEAPEAASSETKKSRSNEHKIKSYPCFSKHSKRPWP